MPGLILKTLDPANEVINVLKTEYMIRRGNCSSNMYGFAIISQDDEITFLVSQLIGERHMIYVKDAFDRIAPRFLSKHSVPSTLRMMLDSVETLVIEQLQKRR